MHDFFWSGPGIIDFHCGAILLEFLCYIDCSGITDIRAVFFEGDTEHEYCCSFDLVVSLNQKFDYFGCYVFAHVVVQSSSSKDDFWMVTTFLSFLGKIVGINADAVAADKAWFKLEKVPFGAGGFEHFMSVDAKAVENHGEFVDKGDVDVALGVFYDFGCFSYLDG